MANDKEIWVFAEPQGEHVARVTLELLGKASELATKLGGAQVAAVLIGSGLQRLTGELSAYGARKIYLADDSRLAYYQSEAYAAVLADLVQKHMPEVLLLGSTDTGKDLAPRVAAKLKTGLTAHCIDLKVEEQKDVPLLCQIVPGWGGDKMINILCPQKRPQMATVRPGVFDLPPATEGNKPEVVNVPVTLSAKHFRAETIEVKEEKPTTKPLEEAEVVIAAGWGVYALGSLAPVEELARVTGGSIGGTRPMVDKGWVPPDSMIGQSGKIISPRLLISLGASGAMHFTTGFERAKFVLAVDQNPQAPIFNVADIGIVGDLHEVLPALIEEFSKAKDGGLPLSE